MKMFPRLAAAAAAFLLAVSCGSGDGDGRPALALTFPASVGEGGSPQGSVRIPEAVGEDIVVSLASSDPYFLRLPSPVTIPAGQTQVAFTATTPDNDYIDPAQSLTLTASHPEYESASLGTQVTDDEQRALVVSLPAGPLAEGSGYQFGSVTLANGALTRTALEIRLESSDPTSVYVPDSVTIPEGGSNVGFAVEAIDDEDFSDETVTITASCDSVPSASSQILVDDTSDEE